MNRQISKKIIFHESIIFLSPAFFIALFGLLLLAAEANVISPTRMIAPLFIFWSILGLLTWPAQKVLKNWGLTGTSLFAFVVGFYLSMDGFYIALTSYLLGLFCIVISFWILKRKLRMRHIAVAANFIAFILVLAPASILLIRFATVDWSMYKTALDKSQKELPAVSESSINNKPDIYYIILDAYGRADVLYYYYQFDNSDFIDFLYEKSFVVPDNSYANYPVTSLSVPSTLNFDYVQNFLTGNEKAQLPWIIKPFFRINKAKLFLENSGYTSISIASNWEGSNNPHTNIYYTPQILFLNEFDAFVIAKTSLRIFKPLISTIAFINSYDSHRQLILYNFDTLEKISEMPEPTFTVAHIIAPHTPFVFDQSGNYVEPGYPFSFMDETYIPLTTVEYRNGYINQLKFINHKLENLIDTILANSDIPPIIILQADHGPRRVTDSSSFDNKCQKERFAIFTAYYLPGMEQNRISDNITPVNLFRIIFNEYFSTELPLLDAHSYAKANDNLHPFEFIDITLDLEKDCPFISP